jgi:hypothetical protein
MVIGCIWAMCALCVVLFIRGAEPHIAHEHADAGELPRPAADESPRLKADRGGA